MPVTKMVAYRHGDALIGHWSIEVGIFGAAGREVLRHAKIPCLFGVQIRLIERKHGNKLSGRISIRTSASSSTSITTGDARVPL